MKSAFFMVFYRCLLCLTGLILQQAAYREW
jgi:hypothetical protein